MKPKFLPPSWNIDHKFERSFGENSVFYKEEKWKNNVFIQFVIWCICSFNLLELKILKKNKSFLFIRKFYFVNYDTFLKRCSIANIISKHFLI